MVEQVRVQELTAQAQKGDCGCGCGGGACGSMDCGCGCGGGACGSTWRELVLVDSAQVAEMRQQAASQ